MLTEEEKAAILEESAQRYPREYEADPHLPKGWGKTTRPKGHLRKRKAAKRMTASSKAKNKPKGLSRRKKAKPLHRRKKRG